MSLLRNVFPALALLLATLSLSSSARPTVFPAACLNVSDYVETAFYNHTYIIRRGAPTDHIQPAFTRLIHVMRWLLFRNNKNGHIRMNQLCLSPFDQEELRPYALRANLEQTLRRDHTLEKGLNFFYLSEQEYMELPPIAYSGKHAYDKAWNTCYLALNDTINDFRYANCALPQTIDVFYDPRERVQQLWRNTFMIERHNPEFFTSCSDFFYETMTIIIRMRVVNVPEEKLKRALDHALAFIFQFIRANRINCYVNNEVHLKVPRSFLLLYYQKYDDWMQQLAASPGPEFIQYNSSLPYVTKEDVSYILRRKYNTGLLLSFSAGGSRFLRFWNTKLKLTVIDSWDTLAGPTQMKHFINAMFQRKKLMLYGSRYRFWHYRKQHYMSHRMRSVVPETRSVSSSTTESLGAVVSRSNSPEEECRRESFWYFAYHLSWPEQCCGDLCVQMENVFLYTAASFEECCYYCNKSNRCNIPPGMRLLAEAIYGVRLQPYGADWWGEIGEYQDTRTLVV